MKEIYYQVLILLFSSHGGCRSDNGKLTNSITLRYILTSSAYGVCNLHYILHLLVVSLKKNHNAPRPSEHPPVMWKIC